MKIFDAISIDDAKTQTGRLTLLIISIFFSINHVTFGQQWISSKASKTETYHHLSRLQTGTLIVVLKSDKKKLDELQNLASSQTASSSQKRKAEKQYKKAKKQRESFHLDLTQAFKDAYTFSDYRFIHDHDLSAFLNGDKHLFVDHELRYNVTMDQTDSTALYFAREGYTSDTESSRVLAYVVHDAEGHALASPFPSVKLTDVGPALLFRSLFEGTEYRKGSVIAERFDYLLRHRMAVLKEQIEKAK